MEKKVEETSDDFTQLAAEVLQAHIKDNWSKSSPSSKGTPPAVVTGNLDSAVVIETQSRTATGQFAGKKGAVRFVVVDTRLGDNPLGRGEYGSVLEEELDRPFMQPAIEETERQLPTLAQRKIKVT